MRQVHPSQQSGGPKPKIFATRSHRTIRSITDGWVGRADILHFKTQLRTGYMLKMLKLETGG